MTDTNWAVSQLLSYISTVDRLLMSNDISAHEWIRDELLRDHYAVSSIVHHAIGARMTVGTADGHFNANRTLAQRAVGALQDRAVVAERLRPTAPELALDTLHPWVWGAAQQFWETRHYLEAVHAAAKSINARVQQLIDRRDLSDNDLMNQAFAVGEPAAGQTRLRVPGDHATGTVRGQQQALRDFAAGCFGVIRNPAAHDTEEWAEQYALERLATLSVLAGLVQGTTAVTGERQGSTTG